MDAIVLMKVHHSVSSYNSLQIGKEILGILTAEIEEFNVESGVNSQRIVLKATELGLGSCWVAKSFSKRK